MGLFVTVYISHVVIHRPPSGAKRRRGVQERRRVVQINESFILICN